MVLLRGKVRIAAWTTSHFFLAIAVSSDESSLVHTKSYPQDPVGLKGFTIFDSAKPLKSLLYI